MYKINECFFFSKKKMFHVGEKVLKMLKKQIKKFVGKAIRGGANLHLKKVGVELSPPPLSSLTFPLIKTFLLQFFLFSSIWIREKYIPAKTAMPMIKAESLNVKNK